MTNEQIIGLAKQAGQTRSTPDNCGIYVWSATPASLQRFAELVRNAALFEAMEVCIDQGELKDHDAMDCYYAIQRLKS